MALDHDKYWLHGQAYYSHHYSLMGQFTSEEEALQSVERWLHSSLGPVYLTLSAPNARDKPRIWNTFKAHQAKPERRVNHKR
jgi:hypothetical protein